MNDLSVLKKSLEKNPVEWMVGSFNAVDFDVILLAFAAALLATVVLANAWLVECLAVALIAGVLLAGVLSGGVFAGGVFVAVMFPAGVSATVMLSAAAWVVGRVMDGLDTDEGVSVLAAIELAVVEKLAKA